MAYMYGMLSVIGWVWLGIVLLCAGRYLRGPARSAVPVEIKRKR